VFDFKIHRMYSLEVSYIGNELHPTLFLFLLLEAALVSFFLVRLFSSLVRPVFSSYFLPL